MALAAGPEKQVGKLVVSNIGLLSSGALEAPLLSMDRAQHSSVTDLFDSVKQGDLAGIGMVVIDGIVPSGRGRNTPPAERVPEVVG